MIEDECMISAVFHLNVIASAAATGWQSLLNISELMTLQWYTMLYCC